MADEQASPRDLVELAPGSPWTVVDQDGASGTGAWRQVDLGLRFPVHTIALGRAGTAPSEVRIAFSDDGVTWASPEIVPGSDSANAAAAIVIVPGEASWTRYIRVAAAEPARDDEAAARVWTERAAFDLIVWRTLMNADFDLVSERPGVDLYRGYRLLGHPDQRSLSVVGIDLYENGAFGNFIIQCLLAIGICIALKLKYIKLPARDRSEVLDYAEPREIGGITFIPASHPLPADGYFLSGMFFDVQVQKLAGDLEQERSRHIITNYIRPFFNRLPARFPEKPDDQLLIHIRSGDIFSTWVAPHYPQPPLAFYKLVIARLMAEKRIASIKLVFENRLNPVIPELEAHIAGLGIPFTTQSGTLADDVAALVNGRYLVFGLGTFGPGVCHLSERVEEVYYFASGWPQHFRGIPTIGKIVEVVDRAGAYTKVGEWDNSPERRQMMIDYPIEQLAFDDRT
ncbi:coagulation factor 5 8 type domain-containing protein [Methylobacterium mesophilicum SR1.6/6]|uniref:Coagulation factor 5 8 type domain-containing protein n=1 Tax=Methylobacterium mesophilicum SR1.6/6 TaxID=908290 RepID=A0A6B9FD48_9HYPH|nr:coagulation factor 5/8 type domain-containing protein [Methylobacterium mesophilicum]QGY01233.1 coagulation factor 5 8 type domain-containing protein [Methylobacterium mesophilicum SR1.6/6]